MIHPPKDLRQWSLKRLAYSYGSADTEVLGDRYREEILRRLSASRRDGDLADKLAKEEAKVAYWIRQYQDEANENGAIRKVLGLDPTDPDETLSARTVADYIARLRAEIDELKILARSKKT